MQGKNKLLFRNAQKRLERLVNKNQSVLIMGPRQVGKTTLVKQCITFTANVASYPLQNPSVRLSFEKDPSLLIRQVKALPSKHLVFIDEAQKVPELFDAIQYLIDEGIAYFIVTGSSARKLRRRGVNLLPGRVKTFRLDPLTWNELGWIKGSYVKDLSLNNIISGSVSSFEKSLVFGTLPAIITLHNDEDRIDFLKSYTYIYLEEEIRAEALSRKIGAFSRFLELAANESGTNPNFTKLSMESGVSAPAIKEFYNILEETLIIERIDPYLKNARKRILSTPRYYFFDLGVRNALARLPLTDELVNSQKGQLFEHAVILEIIRRIRALNKDYKVCYWRTSGGAEVDCVIDTGSEAIPIEIKSSSRVSTSDARGVANFLQEYPSVARHGYVITNGGKPEQISDNIVAIPWMHL